MSKSYSNPQTPTKMFEGLQTQIKTENHQTSLKNINYQTPAMYSTQRQQRIAEQQQLIRDLIGILNIKGMGTIFNKKLKGNCKINPEDSSKKMQHEQKQDDQFDSKLRQIIDQSRNYEEMLVLLQEIVRSQTTNDSKQQQQSLYERQNYQRMEKAIQNIFITKHKMTIPIHRTLEVSLNRTEVRIADVDDQQNVCYIDSQHTLHVIMAEDGAHYNHQFKRKQHFVSLQWVDKSRIILKTTKNHIFVYQIPEMKFLLTLKPEFQVLLLDYQIFKEDIYIYGYTAHVVNIIKISGKHTDKQYCLENPQNARFLTVLQGKQEGLKREESAQRIQKEHYYGIDRSQQNIIRFDTFVSKSGLFWRCPSQLKISKFTISKCGQNLILILTHRTFQEMRAEKEEHIPFEYFLYRINDKGWLLEKSRHVFNFQEFPFGFLSSENKNNYLNKALAISLPMEPWWLRCFSWQNQLYFISLKTGKVIYRIAVDEQTMSLQAVGSSNSVVLNSHKNLILLSTRQIEKKVIQIERPPQISTRESILQRFQRMQGIPQNLLILLRSIRTNDLQSLELS